MSSTRTPREILLEEAAMQVARDWMAAYRVELAREGRAADGAWPGTLSEARVRVAEQARQVLSKQSMPAPTHGELGRVARLAYNEARRAWRDRASNGAA
jgi:hypothetical protein